MLSGLTRTALAVLIFGSALYGDVEWNQLRQTALTKMHAGQLEEASTMLHAALAALPNQKNVPAVVLWNDLGTVEHSRGLVSTARDAFERALRINAQLSRPDANQSAIALNNLATLAGETHEAAHAEALLRQGYGLLDGARETANDTAALIRANLALTLEQEGRYSEAWTLYRQAGDEVKSRFGEKSLEYARLLANRAHFELQTGRYRNAVLDGQDAVSAEQGLAYVPVFDRAIVANNLGFALLQTDALADSERYLNQAVRLWESLPEQHGQLVSSLNNLGALYERQGRLNEAHAVEAKALGLIEQGAPVDKLTQAAVWNNLGRTDIAQHNFGEARQEMERALALVAGGSGLAAIRYAAVLSNLAALESTEKHYKRAEALYRKTLAIDQKELGAEHPEIASDLSNIATQLVYEKHRGEALEVYTQALAVAEKSFGPVSTPVAHTWRNMAVAYYGNKQFRESAFAYTKALQTNPDGDVSPWLHEYALTLRKLNRFGEAEQAETRALGLEVRRTLAAEKTTVSTRRQDDSGKL